MASPSFRLIFGLLSLLFIPIFANAIPASDHKSQKCIKNDCYQEAFGGPSTCHTRKQHAKSDCSSFLATTISPCPATITQTSYTTKTVSANSCVGTTTDFSTVTITSQTTVGATVTPTASTVTSTVSTTVSTTATTTETVSTSSVISVIGTFTIPSDIDKRDAKPTADCASSKTCKPKTITHSHVPTYASCCQDACAYSSACVCLGATATTKTLQASTSTVKTTVVTTLSATCDSPTTTVTITTSVPAGGLSTILSTTTLTAMTTTTVVTSTITATFTTTSTTTTVTATITACPIQAVAGFGSGLYLIFDSETEAHLVLREAGPVYAYLDSNHVLRLTDGRAIAVPPSTNGGAQIGLQQDDPDNYIVCATSFSGTQSLLECTVPGYASYTAFTVNTYYDADIVFLGTPAFAEQSDNHGITILALDCQIDFNT